MVQAWLMAGQEGQAGRWQAGRRVAVAGGWAGIAGEGGEGRLLQVQARYRE